MALGRYLKKTIKAILKWSMTDTVTENYPQEPAMPSYGGSSLKSASVSSGSSIRDGSNGMHFTVYPATGGKVIETRTYDPRTDRHNTELYVITDKEELGEELAQIITKTNLCR